MYIYITLGIHVLLKLMLKQKMNNENFSGGKASCQLASPVPHPSWYIYQHAKMDFHFPPNCVLFYLHRYDLLLQLLRTVEEIDIMYILVRIEAKGKTRYGRYCLSISLQNNSLHAASCYLVISQLNILLRLAVPFLCHRHQIIEKKKVANSDRLFPPFFSFFSLLTSKLLNHDISICSSPPYI